MKLLFTLLLSVTFFVVAPLAAQPAIQWQISLGGSGVDFGEYMCNTRDSGYLIIGYTSSSDGYVHAYHDSDEVWLVKLSATGNIEWQKSYGGNRNDDGTSILATLDGGYIITAVTNSTDGDVIFNHGGYDVWLIKINDTGKIQWQKTYGGSQSDGVFAIMQKADSSYVFSGFSRSVDGDLTQNAGVQDAWVVGINDTGKILWQKSFGGTSSEYALGITKAKNGAVWVCGYTNSIDGVFSASHGGTDGWVAQLDDTGAINWLKTYGGSLSDGFWAITACKEGGLIAGGGAYSTGGQVTGNHGSGDIWLARLDDTGSILWQKCYGGSNVEGANSIQQTADSGFFVAGYSSSIDGDATACNGNADFWCLKIDASGTLQWQRSMGGTQDEAAYCGVVTNDGGFALAGYSQSNDVDITNAHGSFDVWVIKLSFTASTPVISQLQAAIKVYPNPASGLVNISLPAELVDATLSLSNALGQVVFTNSAAGTRRQIDLANVPEGLYFLNIKNALGQVSTKIVCAR